MKITTQKFYRINGGSTQLEGVTPDILVPNIYTKIARGEKDMDNPIEWDEITRAEYNKNKLSFNKNSVLEKGKQRIAEDTIFCLIDKYADYMKERSDETSQTLMLKKYQEEQKGHEEKYKEFKKGVKLESSHDFKILSADSLSILNDTLAIDRYNAGIKKLKKDIYVNEAVNVLNDMD